MRLQDTVAGRTLEVVGGLLHIPLALLALSLKGGIVYPFGMDWGVAALVLMWTAWAIVYAAWWPTAGESTPIEAKIRFLAVLFFLPAMALLEIGFAPWPAQPGTGAIYRAAARLLALTGTALGAAALGAAIGPRGHYRSTCSFVPYVALGLYADFPLLTVTVPAVALGLAAWTVLDHPDDRWKRAARRMWDWWTAIPYRRRVAMALACLFAFAFLVRLGPGLYIVHRCGYIGCGIDYYDAAVRWYDGHLEMPFREPGTVLLFYLPMLLAGKGFAAITVVQCLLGAAVPVLTYLVCRRCFPEWMAWTCATATALYGQLVVFSYFLGSENLQIVSMLVVLLLAMRALDSMTWRNALWLGACFGLVVLIKPSGLLAAVPVVAAAKWGRPWRAWAGWNGCMASACVLVVVAWMALDYRVSGQVHFATRLINEFVLSNHPLQVNGINWDWDKRRNAFDVLREDYGFVGENPQALSNNLYISGLTTRWANVSRVVRYRIGNLGGTVHLLLRKLYQLYFRPFICPERFDFTHLLEDTFFYWYGRCAFVLLWVVGMAAWRWRAGPNTADRFILAVVPVAFALGYAVFSPSPRNNMPAVPAMLILALLGVWRLTAWADRLTARNR